MFSQLQRLGYELAFRAITGSSLHIGSLDRDGGALRLRDVRVTASGGDAVFAAASVRIAAGRDQTQVAIDRPSGSLTLGKNTLRRLSALRGGIAMFTGPEIDASISDGSLTVTREEQSAPPLVLRDYNGTIAVSAGTMYADGDAVADDGTQTYPVVLSGGRMRAAALPLAPVWALLPPSSVSLASGTLQDVDVALSRLPSGTFSVRHAAGTYDGHALRALHGTVVFSNDGIASRELSGLIDNVPLQISGETHDVANWGVALGSGTSSLRTLARIYASIAPTPNLHSIRLEANGPGIAYAQYTMLLDSLPRAVQLLTIDPKEKTLHFDTALSGDHLVSNGERTSQMGVRTHAIAGLNGDYFDIGRTYQPQGLFMESGRLMRGPADRESLIVDKHNHVYFDDFKLRGNVQIGSDTFPVTQFNDWPLGYVTIITPDFGKTLPPAPGVRFLALQYVRGDRYRVIDESASGVPSPLHFGIALGPDIKLHALPAIGDEIHLSYGVVPYVKDAVAGIGGGPLLLRGGKWFEDPKAPAPDERDVRWPVDALGVLTDGTLMMVAVDGRHPERSVGMTRPEFGKLLQDLGVTDAMALDSGGSVTMVARSPGDTDVSLHNVPSDDSAERYVSNALFVYSSASAGSLLQNKTTASTTASN